MDSGEAPGSETTVDIALRAAERLYGEEDERFRHSEQKGVALLAVAGVLLTVFSARTSSLSQPSQLSSVTDACLGPLLRGLALGATAALVIAFIFGLVSLRPRTAFQRLRPGDLAKPATLALSPDDLKRFLLERYTEFISANSMVTERKLESIRAGFIAILVALSLMVTAAILQAVR